MRARARKTGTHLLPSVCFDFLFAVHLTRRREKPKGHVSQSARQLRSLYSKANLTMSVLIAKPTPPLFFQVEEGTISYDDSGENEETGTSRNPVIILVPGIGDLRSTFRLLTPLLQAQGYRVIQVDLRGLGETKGNFKDFSAKAVGQDLVKLVFHLGIGISRGVIVFGSSMASAAAVW